MSRVLPGLSIAAGVLVLMYGLFVAAHMWLLIGESGGVLERTRVFSRPDPAGHPRILVIGDSTAVGTGTTDPRGTIAGRLGRDYAQAEVINRGVNGLRSAGLDRAFPTVVDGYYDFVLVQIGANDLIRGTPLPAFEASLRSVFRKAKRAGQSVAALHCGNLGIAPLFRMWPVSAYARLKSLEMRALYRRITTEEGVTYVDLFHEPKDDPLRGSEFYASDGLHLNEDGYAEWYRELRRTLARDRLLPNT